MDQVIRPTADGTYQQVEYPSRNTYPHWVEVSEQDDDYYIGTDYNGQRIDTFVMENPSRSGIVTNFRVYIRGRSRPSIATAGKTALYLAGEAIQLGEEVDFSASFADYYTDYSLNPWTSANWTWDQLDSIQAGVALIGLGSSYPYSECAEVWGVITSVPLSCGGAQIIGLELL